MALIPDETVDINGVRVNKYNLNEHNINDIPLPDTKIRELLGVTIHNTNRIKGVDDEAERYTEATVDGDMNDVRVHFYVDKNGAWQTLPLNSTGWHAADDMGDGNSKTISLEVIMDSSTEEDDIRARDNAARLAAEILYNNRLDENDLYTHTHWLNVRDGIEGDRDYLNTLPNPYKYCPIYILPDWFSFKALVGNYIYKLKEENGEIIEPYFAEITTGTLNVRSGAGTKYPVTARVFGGEVYRIIDKKTVNGEPWGKLSSGAGWVNLNFTKRV